MNIVDNLSMNLAYWLRI